MASIHTAARAVNEGWTRRYSGFQGLASFAIIVAILYVGRVVLVPLAAATLLTLVLVPAIRLLERLRMGRTLAVTLVMAAGLVIVGFLGFTAEQRIAETAMHWPEYRAAIRSKASGLVEWVNRFEASVAEMKDVFTDPAETGSSAALIRANAGDSAASPRAAPDQPPLSVRIAPQDHPLLSSIAAYSIDMLATLGSMVLVLTLLAFLLLRWEDARFRLLLLVGSSESSVIDGTLAEAIERVSRVLLVQSAINACFGMAAAIGIWGIHATFAHQNALATAITAGMFCGILRFVPFAGIWIGAGVPLLFTLAACPDNTAFYALLVMFVILELITSQWIEPHWLGAQAGLSPVGVLVSALFWTWLWGPVGLLMSTPLAVILVVLGKHAPSLRYIHILLSNRKQLATPARVACAE